MEPSDALAGVNQHSPEGMRVFFDEGQKVLGIAKSWIGGEFYLEGQELSAMFQDKVDFLREGCSSRPAASMKGPTHLPLKNHSAFE
jgi:hypothetical protein